MDIHSGLNLPKLLSIPWNLLNVQEKPTLFTLLRCSLVLPLLYEYHEDDSLLMMPL